MMTAQEGWERIYMIGKWRGWSFRKAARIFRFAHGYRPPTNLNLMPMMELDWFREIADVPRNELIGQAVAAMTQVPGA